MFKNFLKITSRNLIRHCNYSFINIFSLTVGLATSIFIFLWVMDEMSFDKFHTKAGRLYSVIINNRYPDGNIETYGATPAKLKDAIHAGLSEVDEITQVSMETDLLLKYDNNSFNENGIYSDSAMFSIFSFPIVKGNLTKPLENISSIAISENLAKKFFGDENPIGKSLQVGQSGIHMITAVFADIPKNSSLQFQFVLPFSLYIKENPWTQHWQSGGTKTFITLKPGISLKKTNEKLAGMIRKNCQECTSSPFLFEYSKSHLYNEFENGKTAGGRISQVILFSIVALIILVMACINFMNLATARSASRSREVGVRKVMGARMHTLISHFIAESVMLSFIALALAVVIVQLLLPIFNSVTEKTIQLDFTNPAFVGGLVIITLICGLLAGSYPAVFLSSVKPSAVLKGSPHSSLSGSSIRKTLVVIQFATSIVLIAGTIAIYKQIVFISNKNLGFEKENMIVLNKNEDISKKYDAFKNNLLQLPSVKSIGFGGSNIFTIPITSSDPVWEGKPENSSVNFKIFRCDADFIPTMGIQMLSGRNFSNLNNLDSANYIVNKKAMEIMGLTTENVIGAELDMWQGKGRIIGLTNDFHNDNLRVGIEPLIFLYSKNVGFHYYIKVDGKRPVKETLMSIGTIFKKFSPEYPFEYSFLDQVFDKEYRNDVITGKLSLSFTIVAMLIACLGLFGLSAFTAERRIKELGIRKVVGASTSSLLFMLCSDFTKLVLIGLLIGIPVAWYLTDSYLSSYAFHIDNSIWIFVLTSITILLIAIGTVAYQSLKAARANPVRSLRSE